MQGTILALAFRSPKGSAMHLSDSLGLTPIDGVVEDYGSNKRRQISLLDEAAWDAACFDVGSKLPWYVRRANVLVQGLNLKELKGRIVQIGNVSIRILGEVTPCHVMDSVHAGLKKALESDWRGGVYGQILVPGTIYVGDAIRAN